MNQFRAPNARPQLLAPGMLFQNRGTPTRSQHPQASFNQVSNILRYADRYQPQTPTPRRPATLPTLSFTQPQQGLRPLAPVQGLSAPQNIRSVGNTPYLNQKLSQAVQTGLNEWKSGVKETSRNAGGRINLYHKTAKFESHGGREWCGFFVGFSHAQAGFKYPESLASYQKSRDFFMYRSYTNKSATKNKALDQLRQEHTAQGSTRQYFMMAESNNHKYVSNYKKFYSHFDTQDHTYSYNNLPIQAGDVALFNRGHVGMVVSYNPQTGILKTVEGNTSGTGPNGKRWSQAVVTKEYDLTKATDREKFDGFGRPAQGDYA